ncbi:Sec-independent protein translocase subunit TatA/TatB [Mucilaginibacter psychrotolerans]|uniref:Sec-independent protein translocase protein TatA n=1 Tax=Mucilaginibacter psychrotolerans TaxID=1524096 RepID=A0A4Y8SIR6_9SPHI|nr:twin-arginine translocase TatA/TatE family subunit [Mucilaginibacter psychrotolerans]TFF38306.1 twin-arginine translocase TatA/TatE family subunit [Mucilaginibacter psychrotolerans]
MLSTVFLFLNIGSGEMILIVFAALMLFGGEKLPEIARGLGKGIRDFKDASEDVKREINNQINNYEDKKTDLKKSLEEKNEEKQPDPAQPAYVPIEGTLPAFEGHSATDVVADETPDYVHPVYEGLPEAEHTTVAAHDNGSSINLTKAEEPVKKTIEEEYK